jgi:hypothetical protein
VSKRGAPTPSVAALEAVDPDRRLPGEPEESDLKEEIQRWIAVYKDLLDTKRVMLKAAEKRIAGASEEARKEYRRTDATTLAAERRRLERRLGFWRRRLRAVKAVRE